MLLDKTPDWQVRNSTKIFDVLITARARHRGEKKKCVGEKRVYCQNYPIANCNKIVYMQTVLKWTQEVWVGENLSAVDKTIYVRKWVFGVNI